MSDINIIFYSRQCDTCNKLLQLLQSDGILSSFKLFCVDGRLNQIPPQITIVPSMIVKNNNKILVANEIFEWIKNIKFIRGEGGVGGKQGPIGWVDGEMNGTSDGFAYTNVDKAQPKSYFKIGGEEENAIYTAPDIGKINKKEQNDMIKNLEGLRNQQDEIYATIAKKQLDAIVNDGNGNGYE